MVIKQATQTVVGFDAREMYLDPDVQWRDDRRKQFLIVPSVRKPLSVDLMVWPSVFDVGTGFGLPIRQRTELGLAGPPLPEGAQLILPLWDSVSKLTSAIQRTRNVRHPFWVVAITHECLATDREPDVVTANRRDDGWLCLGYDVATPSLLSALTNCGFPSAVDIEEFRATWTPRINSHHLFHRVEDADQFRGIPDVGEPEEGGLQVFGIWKVAEGSCVE